MKRQVSLLTAILLFASLATGSAQVQLRPGQYEVTADIDLAGFPSKPMKYADCLTESDVKDLPKLLLGEAKVSRPAKSRA